MAASPSHEEQALVHPSNRRRGWVIASEDGTEMQRPTSFDPRRSAAAWNKGQGPSQASIPSRASSLTPASPSAAATAAMLHQHGPSDVLPTASPSGEKRSLPPKRHSSSADGHDRYASNSSTGTAANGESSSSGRRRPSPPLLELPKQTYRKVPSGRVLPPSAYTDHQKLLAGTNRAQRPVTHASSSSSAEQASSPALVQPRSPIVGGNFGLRSDLVLLAARRRATNSSASSSATGTSSTPFQTPSNSTPATSTASTSAPYPQNGKGKQPATRDFKSDDDGFFSTAPASAQADAPSRPWTNPQFASSAHSPLLHASAPLPALSAKSATSDHDDGLSSTSESASDSEGTAFSGARPGKRRESLRIELPPPPPQFKDRYPSIMVDSTHASDSEASGTSTGVQRRRRRRSTASTNLLGVESEAADDDDEDFADDDSSWPSTPSTTPLENYFTTAEVRPKPARRAFQTTKEIIKPDPGLGMGRPMVVVTSPSTASEVSSDRRSSSGSGSTSDRMISSSPPAATTVAPTPALSKIEEHPAQKVAPEPSSAPPPRRSLSFDLPAAAATRSSADVSSGGAHMRSPSRAMAFLAKFSPSRSANRSSTDLTPQARAEATVEIAKRLSFENPQRASVEHRRSVELRPILLNAATRPQPRPLSSEQGPSRPTSSSSAAVAQPVQQRRQSSGRIAVRPNVVPYHSRRSSDHSDGSSTKSPLLQDRGSFDRDPVDPTYSPMSQDTTLTMPSPALSTDQKPFAYHSSANERNSADQIEPRTSSARSSQERAAASAVSLHHPSRGERRSASQEETSARPSAIRLLVDSQKGRVSKDNDSIAEWISVSVNDLPLRDARHPYGNGGAGEFSNEQQKGAKKLEKKPWKLGRFAASEVVLPTKAAAANASSSPLQASAQVKRRSVSLMKRASSPQVNRTASKAADSASSPSKGPHSLMRNLGFTTANRNVVLQNLCAERSISALAASTIYIAGCGRINVPEPRSVPAAKLKSKSKPQPKADSKLAPARQPSPVPIQSASLPAAEVDDIPVLSTPRAELSEEAHLNVKEDVRVGYDLSGAGIGTVKSIMPETGDWSGSSGHDSVPVADQGPATFRDYDDEGSDLFDSEHESVESESEADYGEEEEAEVPVRFGQRFSAASRAVEVPSPTKRPSLDYAGQTRADSLELGDAVVGKVAVSPSLKVLTPGLVVLRGAEMRICVEDYAASLGYWKALQVQHAKRPSNDIGQAGQVRKQPSNKAMKLEEEVATGIFAGFVGNRSPKRQAQRSNSDLSSQNAPGQSQDAKELLISKLDHSIYSVRSDIRQGAGGREQVLEILCRSTASKMKLERAFPSPLLEGAEFAHGRSRSGRTDGSQASLDDMDAKMQRITIRVQRKGGRGFAATFQTREGQQWTWHASKLEASVLTRADEGPANGSLSTLENYDLSLRTMLEHETIELASYSTESQVRNALGIFRPRTKAVPKPMPDDASQIGPAVPAPAQVLPLAVPHKGFMSPLGRAEVPIPRRGIRGGPLLRPQAQTGGSAARHHGLWQNQRAAISTEAVVKVHNNAVNNARASLQLEERPGLARAPTDDAQRLQAWRAAMSDQQEGGRKLGELTFSSHAAADRDLIVLSLFAVLGMAEP